MEPVLTFENGGKFSKMEQPKYNLLKDIELILRSKIDDDNVFSELVEKLSFLLNNYEITNKTYELACYDDENIRILNRYKACLLVEGKSPQTIEAYSFRIRHMFENCRLNLKDMGPYDIRMYLAMLKQNGCSNRTLEVIRNYISAFYKWAVLEEIVDKNPCAPIKPIKYTEEIRESFTELDIDKLRTSCKDLKERAIVELLLTSGIRVSEMENMNVTDIDFPNCAVHVKHGKGDKERITYMSPVAAHYIDKYIQSRDDKDVALFTTKTGRLQSGGIRYILHELGERADVEDVHPHRFRRTFATNLNSKGMPIQYIQHLLGHARIDTTMIYVNVNEAQVKSEYQKYMAA